MPIEVATVRDGEEIAVTSNGRLTLLSWHPPRPEPDGRPYGAAGFCVTAAGHILLISNDGDRWDLPGGRPEGNETWPETLRREVLEEACATVTRASLLGYVRAVSFDGPDQGNAIVRSLWRADVDVAPWHPQFEIKHLRIVTAEDAWEYLVNAGDTYSRIFARGLQEAGLKLM